MATSRGGEGASTTAAPRAQEKDQQLQQRENADRRLCTHHHANTKTPVVRLPWLYAVKDGVGLVVRWSIIIIGGFLLLLLLLPPSTRPPLAPEHPEKHIAPTELHGSLCHDLTAHLQRCAAVALSRTRVALSGTLAFSQEEKKGRGVRPHRIGGPPRGLWISSLPSCGGLLGTHMTLRHPHQTPSMSFMSRPVARPGQ